MKMGAKKSVAFIILFSIVILVWDQLVAQSDKRGRISVCIKV